MNRLGNVLSYVQKLLGNVPKIYRIDIQMRRVVILTQVWNCLGFYEVQFIITVAGTFYKY